MRTLLWLTGVLLFLIAVALIYGGGREFQGEVERRGLDAFTFWKAHYWRKNDDFTVVGRALVSLGTGFLGAFLGYRFVRLVGRMG